MPDLSLPVVVAVVAVAVVLLPQQALDERVPRGRIVLGRAPSAAQARVEPLGLDDEAEAGQVGEHDAHLFAATLVAAGRAFRPVIAAVPGVRLAVGPANRRLGRDGPTAASAAAAMTFARLLDGVASPPCRLARGAPDRRVGGGGPYAAAAVEESVQDRKSAAVVVGVVRLAGETRRFRTRPQRELQRGVSGSPAAPFPRSQQPRHVHVPPPAAVQRQQQVADVRRFFPRRGHAVDPVHQTAIRADPHVAAGGVRDVFPPGDAPVDPRHRFDDCRPVAAPAVAVYHRSIDRERDLREHDVTAAATVVWNIT